MIDVSRQILREKMMGEANQLYSYHLSCGLRSALLVEDHTQAGEYTPGLFQPENAQNKKGVLYYGSRWLAACNRKLKSSLLAR